jgi:hypothetical protein
MQLSQKHWRYEEWYCILGKPLDEGAQGFPWVLLDGMEVDLVARPSISTLEVGRELVAQL